MTVWTPGAPETLGLEWMAAKNTVDTVAGNYIGSYAQTVRSLAAEAITGIAVYTNTPAYFGGMMSVDVYVEGTEIVDPADITTTRYFPTNDRTEVRAFNQAGNNVNLYQSVDEYPVVFTDYVTQSGAAGNTQFSSIWGGFAAYPAGNRVLDLRIIEWLYTPASAIQATTTQIADGGGVNLLTADTVYYNATSGIFTRTVHFGPDNPFTGFPWTNAVLTGLNTGAGNLEILLVCADLATGAGPASFQLGGYYIEVDTVPENRVAVANGLVTAAGIQTFANVRAPDTGVAGWAKANATNYTYVLRGGFSRLGTTGAYPTKYLTSLPVPGIDSGSVAPLQTYNSAQSYTIVEGEGGIITSMTPTTRLRAIIPQTVGPVTGESAQPYFKRFTRSLAAFAEQSLTPGTTRAFATVRCLVRPIVDSPGEIDITVTTTAPVTISSGQITEAQALASPNVGTVDDPWYLVDVPLFSVVTLTAATQYYVRLTAAGAFWEVAWLDGFTAGLGTLGGATDTYRPTGVADVSADMPLVLTTLVLAPPDFGAAVTTVDLGDGTNCSLDEYEAVTLTWLASLDTLIDYVEIQRYDANVGDWETIAQAGDGFAAQTLTFTDYEVAQNIESCYRARTVRIDGSTSVWTASTATITDTFTHTSSLMGTTTTGDCAWVSYDSAVWQVTANQAAYASGGGAFDGVVVVHNPAQTTGFVQATMGAYETGWGLCCGLSSSTEYYYVRSTVLGVYELFEVVAGVHTSLSATAAGFAVGLGTVLRLEWAQGATMALEVFVNGVSVLADVSTGAPTTSQTGCGLWADSTMTAAARWDDFSCTGNAGCITPAFPGCGLIFVPHGDPARIVGYVWPTQHEYTFQSAEKLVTFPIFGRDGQVALYPTENTGDTFTAALTLNAVDTPTAAGRWVFDDIVDLSRDGTLGYVAVLDETGRRWFAALRCAKGTRREPGALYIAEVQVIQTAFTASVLVV